MTTLEDIAKHDKINLEDFEKEIAKLYNLDPEDYALKALQLKRGVEKSKGLEADIRKVFTEAEHNAGFRGAVDNVVLKYQGSEHNIKGKLDADKKADERLYELWKSISSNLKYKEKDKTKNLFGDFSSTSIDEALNQLQNYVSILDQKDRGETWAQIVEHVKEGNMKSAYQMIMTALGEGYVIRRKGKFGNDLLPSEGLKDDHYKAIASIINSVLPQNLQEEKMWTPEAAKTAFNLMGQEKYDELHKKYKPNLIDKAKNTYSKLTGK